MAEYQRKDDELVGLARRDATEGPAPEGNAPSTGDSSPDNATENPQNNEDGHENGPEGGEQNVPPPLPHPPGAVNRVVPLPMGVRVNRMVPPQWGWGQRAD